MQWQVFKLEITLGNDAFGTDNIDKNAEIARILQRAATRIFEDGNRTLLLDDINGNLVGSTKIVTRRD